MSDGQTGVMTETASKDRLLVVCVMGPPGSGKGTQAVRIAETFGIDHLSTGDLLRQEIKDGTTLGGQAEKVINQGRLAPDEIVNQMIHQRIENLTGEGKGLLLDGYPRTVDQLEFLLRAVGDLGLQVQAFFFLDIKSDLLVERLMARMVCAQCAAVYNAISKPPLREGWCDLCGGRVGFRADDNREAIRKRFDVYLDQTEPILDAIEGRVNAIRIPADRSPQEIYEDIERHIREMP